MEKNIASIRFYEELWHRFLKGRLEIGRGGLTLFGHRDNPSAALSADAHPVSQVYDRGTSDSRAHEHERGLHQHVDTVLRSGFARPHDARLPGEAPSVKQ